ncbi:MAG TPA: hypothetical protein VL400_00875 [Polyangiaceae bacterium]|nr:hypothetical protein [Polyangiaceae bacterium]
MRGRRRGHLVGLAAVLAAALSTDGCASSTSGDGSGAAPTSDVVVSAAPVLSVDASASRSASPRARVGEPLAFTATVVVGGGSEKAFDGIVLRESDGTKWIASHERDPLWAAFEGQTVSVVGTASEPADSALSARSIQAASWKIVDPKKATLWLSVGPVVELTGTLIVSSWPKGSKLEGSDEITFRASDGKTYSVVHRPEGLAAGTNLRVRARALEWSPFAQHAGTDPLWIVSAP